MQANSTINFTIVSYDLRGNEVEMRPLTLGDLNLCNQFSSPVNLWEPSVKFAENFFAKCSLNLRELIERQADVDTKFSSLHLNYYENQANFLQTVPILIRNAFAVNEVRSLKKLGRVDGGGAEASEKLMNARTLTFCRTFHQSSLL
jgi:hypothetical protein